MPTKGVVVGNPIKSSGRLLSLFALSIGLACAGEDDGPDYAAETLTGDWGGLRPAWHAQGLAVDLGYRWDMLRVAAGGLRRGGRPIGHLDVKVGADLEQLVGWQGGRAFVNLLYDGGGKINRDHLGSQLGISNIEVPVSTARWFQAWVEQSFDEGRWALLGGLYPIDSEFMIVESAGLFVQPPYGTVPDLALTRGPSIFNNPAVGLRAKWQSDGMYAMGAVLDGIPGDPQRPKGTHVRFDKGDGAMQIVEAGYRSGDDDVLAKLALGVWRYTAKVNDLVDVDADGAAVRRRSTGWYALGERSLWRWEGGDVAGFLRFGATDGDSTAIKKFYNAGIRVRGLLPGREDDLFGLGWTRGAIGDKFRASQAAAGSATAGAESAVEITYRIQANKWLAVQPLIQRYRNPGAASAVPDATVVGARLEFVL